ncbi:MAG TPA: inorganic phosphate transporter [Phycisphaerales bacterium]|nr:inorganic phosphate transporter [Phycisphaerales bacterium]
MAIALIIAVLWLAYSNGANDNFKGVATLYGSGAASFNRARAWATIATIAGSLVSVVFAASLARKFSGGGLVPAEFASSSALLISVGAAGAATVLLATLLGMPTSTTHALTGALVGVALFVNGGPLPLAKLWSGFFLPLLVSPIMAVALAGGAYIILRRLRLALGVTRETCVCVGPARALVPVALTVGGGRGGGGGAALVDQRSGSCLNGLSVSVGETSQCVERYSGTLVGVDAQIAVTTVHYASAGAVCFARAVNDTPKIAALLMAFGGVGGAIGGWQLGIVAAAMAVGGLIQARKVAETMSKRITALNPGQGLTGNLVTALLVIGASRFGLPVSTTHVSVGSIFGIGVVGGRPQWKTVGQIGTAWLTTLPLGGLLGAGLYLLLSHPSIASA